MLISMVVVFGTCWLPLQTINFIADLGLVDIFCWEYHHFSECTKLCVEGCVNTVTPSLFPSNASLPTLMALKVQVLGQATKLTQT